MNKSKTILRSKETLSLFLMCANVQGISLSPSEYVEAQTKQAGR